jgi:hypothetical protein
MTKKVIPVLSLSFAMLLCTFQASHAQGHRSDRPSFKISSSGLEPVFEFIRSEYLHVNLKVSLHAFSILLQFSRPVLFGVGEVEYARYGAKTWQKQITGTHGGGPDYILQSLGLLLDAFLRDYLKVNFQ